MVSHLLMVTQLGGLENVTAIHRDSEHAMGGSGEGPPCLFLRKKHRCLNMTCKAFHNLSQTYVAIVMRHSQPPGREQSSAKKNPSK